ncbi:MAG: hypothetical protein RLZZ557_2087, partial [Bacteroidota bacterium]
MNKYFCNIFLLVNLIFSLTLSVVAQNSASNPFTSLGYARGVTSAGTYYFNIGGTTFSTQVDASGYIMVAIDLKSQETGNLAQGTALTTTADGILSSSILSLFTTSTVDQLKVTSLLGDLDAV